VLQKEDLTLDNIDLVTVTTGTTTIPEIPDYLIKIKETIYLSTSSGRKL
jgi:hypothetical protein